MNFRQILVVSLGKIPVSGIWKFKVLCVYFQGGAKCALKHSVKLLYRRFIPIGYM